ncbi:MAG: SurA N-terminal domain-containing protein [Pseudomonadota bacterium]
MQVFRNLVQGWFGKLVLGVIILLFVLMGSEALLNVLNKEKPALTVNDVDVSKQQIAQLVDQRWQQLQQQYQGQMELNASMKQALEQTVTDQMVNRLIFQSSLEEFDIDVSNTSLAEYIQSQSQFKENETFSRDVFDRFARQIGYSPKELTEEIKKDLGIQRLSLALAAPAFIHPKEIDELYQLYQQRRSIQLLQFSKEQFAEKITVTDQEIEKFYKENKTQYLQPASARFDYLELKVADVKVDSPSDEELKKAYEDYLKNGEAREEREIAHILIHTEDKSKEDVQKKIETIQSRLKLEDFAVVAKDLSDDAGSRNDGGNLGFAPRGSYEPAFEKAAFSMKTGEISEPVETEYGFHIIKLLTIQDDKPESFEVQKDSLITAATDEKQRVRFVELADEIKRLAFETDDLEQSAAISEQKIKKSDWMDKDQGTGIFADAKVRNALFVDEVLQNNHNSEIIEVADGHVIVGRRAGYREAQIQPLADVKSAIKTKLTDSKVLEEIKTSGQKILTQLKQGQSLADIKAKYDNEKSSLDIPENLNWRDFEIDRRFAYLPSEVVAESFKLSGKNEQSLNSVTTQDMFFIVQLKDIIPAVLPKSRRTKFSDITQAKDPASVNSSIEQDDSIAKEEIKSPEEQDKENQSVWNEIENNLKQRVADSFVSAFLEQQKIDAKIKINNSVDEPQAAE